MRKAGLALFALAAVLMCRFAFADGKIEKSPIRQFQRMETVEVQGQQAAKQAAPDDFKTEYIKVKNYQASFLAETVRGMLSPDGLLQANDDLSVIIISDKPDKIEQVKAMIGEVDKLPRQIVFHAKILEVSNNFEKDSGMTLSNLLENTSFNEVWNRITNDRKQSYDDNYSYQQPSWREQNDTSMQKGVTSQVATRYDHVSQMINFLITKGYAKMVAEPKIVTVNNKPGRFFIGDKVKLVAYGAFYSPYSGSTAIAGGGSMAEEGGLSLEVTPHIGESEFITINIKATYSQLDSYSSTSTKVNAREAESTIIVKDKEPIVLGGYKITREGRSKSETPILGSIPVIKKIFSKTIKSKEDAEMVMILIPEIVNAGEGFKTPDSLQDTPSK
ncbi:MAG: secretin N-terminal domain-containing protein [bacterium]